MPGKVDYSGNNFKYLPFGSGRRVWAGYPWGSKILKYTVASFLHSFEWQSSAGPEVEFSDKFGLVTKKMNPLVAVPRPRLSKLELYSELSRQPFYALEHPRTITSAMMETNMFSGLALGILLVVLSHFFFRATLRRFGSGRPSLPPGPRGLPFLGYLPFLRTDLHREFAKLSETYGPIYKLWLGNKLCVVITSPSLVKEITRDHDSVFANRDMTIAASTLFYNGKDIAFSDYGTYWMKIRKLFVREMMSNSSLDATYDLRRLEVRKCIGSLYEKARSPVDIGELVYLLLSNTIMEMLWGHTLESEKEKGLRLELRKVVGDIMVVLAKPNISDVFPALACFDIQGVKRQAKRLNDWFENFLSIIISHATERKSGMGVETDKKVGHDRKPRNIVQLLFDLQMEGKEGNALSEDENQELKAVLTDIVVGGTDTTSTMVEWVMALLLQHRDVLDKVMAELTEIVGTNSIVEEFHLRKLKYLEAIVKETLRLYPAAPLLLSRRPSQSVVVGRYMIPKDTRVYVNVWAIHRDPQLWEDPLEFKPDRFLENSGKFDYSGNNFAYLPFGSGRRVCAGLPLADKMLKYILASLLHSFEWELPDGVELEFKERFGIVCKKLKPLVAIPMPRLSRAELYA
ncbi:hypothetical protein SAY86_029267 [Trapa natans]|uniref:Uncharacterized protein n=1 Tax=Trapa natans TaxID=22666 RepID=A0AAN7ML13_TRANT|nr:hypothetical protein SAY86_029267 [Trapa natans]